MVEDEGGDRTFTFNQMDEISNQYAAFFASQGLKRLVENQTKKKNENIKC